MTKVKAPLFIIGEMSRSRMNLGGWNSGGMKAWAMRRDRTELSSSTIAIEALCNSCELLRACMMIANEKA